MLGDFHRLQQVLWNLLTNAVKFTPKGGRIQISLERVNSHLEISVADTGQGISHNFLPYVFDRFRQAESAISRRHGGLGLGLAIVKQIVELHGGTVRGKARAKIRAPRLRSCCRCRFTTAGARPIPSARETTSPEIFVPPDLNGVKVLVVDDEPDARDVIRRLLVHSRRGSGRGRLRGRGAATVGHRSSPTW